MRTLLRSVILLLTLLAVVPLAQAASPEASDPPGWLGIALGSSQNPGALVRGVVEGSPADESGLRAKDAIVAVDGIAVSGAEELMAHIRSLEPGSFVTLSVKRRGRDFEVKTVLRTRGERERLRLVRGWLGVEVIDLPASLRAHFGAPEDAGVLVSAVSEPSPAYDSGIRVGDVIYEADGQPVTSVGALSQFVGEAGVENVIDVVLARDGARIVVAPRIERVPAPPETPNQ